jgi:hypothetical protein
MWRNLFQHLIIICRIPSLPCRLLRDVDEEPELLDVSENPDSDEASVTASYTVGGEGEDDDRMSIVTRLLRTVESQAQQGSNCTPGTDLNLGVKVVNRYAQERFHGAALVRLLDANPPKSP